MAIAVVSGFLDINNGGAPFDDIALVVYAGMILEAFNKSTTTKGRHIERTIQSGKSAQFPITGRVATNTHTRGTEITFLQVHSNERVLAIDDILMAPIFLDILDEAKTHFDIRRPYATSQGQVLAETDDLRVLQSIVAAANITTPNFTGGDVGLRITNASMTTDAAVLKGAIYEAAERLDDNSVSSEDRSVWLSPAQFYLLLQDGEFLDRDFGGEGSRATAVMRNAADFTVVKTTNMPSTDETSNTALPAAERLDFQLTTAIAAHSSAAGSVSLIGLQFESEYDMNRQGHMLIAKYAKGYGYLRPESAFELATA